MKKVLFFLMASVSLMVSAQHTFQLGGDISMLPQYESVSTPYYDTAGKKIDPLSYMQNTCKMNAMRVRLFVEPDASQAKSGVVQDLSYVQKLGKRIKDAGMDFLLDIHYSDTWADPSSQSIPKSWYSGTLSSSNPSNAAMVDSMYSYTKRCLEYLKANGAQPDFVQIGNEISFGMLWRTTNDRCYTTSTTGTWKRFTNLLSSGIKAVREVTPDAKIVLHVERVGNSTDTPEIFYNKMKSAGVDYDIIGLSYYPFWHKSLANLGSTIDALAKSFPDKQVQIVETAYYYQYFPTGDKDYDNTTGTWAGTPSGQAQFISDLCSELAKHDNVTGLYYWFPEENGSGGSSWSASNEVLKTWINRGLWDNSTHKANAGLFKLQEFLTAKQATHITSITSTRPDDSAYTLQGLRINEVTYKGIYIKGGKKYRK